MSNAIGSTTSSHAIGGGVHTTVVRGNIFLINSQGNYPSRLGQGINGFIPPPIQDTNNFSEYAQTRHYLREGYNTRYGTQKTLQGVPAKINTPFRLAMNAGDPLSRKYYTCGGSTNQVKRPQNNGLRGLYGNIKNLCDGTGVESATCNIKFVYDSSDYIRYKKNFAINKNYNDLSNGGNDSSGSQSAYRAIRRY